MVKRTWAILRTVYLLAVTGYALWATPWNPLVIARTFDEQYARCAGALAPLTRAAWAAIAWIALETAVGWAGIWLEARAGREKAAAPPASAPPPA